MPFETNPGGETASIGIPTVGSSLDGIALSWSGNALAWSSDTIAHVRIQRENGQIVASSRIPLASRGVVREMNLISRPEGRLEARLILSGYDTILPTARLHGTLTFLVQAVR